MPALKDAFRAVRDVCAKFNASIRARYPKSSPLARAVTRGTGGLFCTPYMIVYLRFAAEDALYAAHGKRYRFDDDSMEIYYAADEWARPNRTDPWKRRKRGDQPKSVSIVERALFDLIRARSDTLYTMCVGLPQSAALSVRQKVRRKFERGLDAVESALKRARRHPEPTYKLLMALRMSVPPDCAAMIVEYVA